MSREVVVEGAAGHARPLDDLLGADARVPALGEQLTRRRDERRARRLRLSRLDFHTTCMLSTYRLYVKEAFMKHEVHLPQGTIRYREDGTGEPLLFVHGVLVNGSLWRKVVPRLSKDFRCIVPTGRSGRTRRRWRRTPTSRRRRSRR